MSKNNKTKRCGSFGSGRRLTATQKSFIVEQRLVRTQGDVCMAQAQLDKPVVIIKLRDAAIAAGLIKR